MVRAKFILNSYTTQLQTMGYDNGADGKPDYSKPHRKEMRTLNMTPVYAQGDELGENKSFWDASPSGSLQLGIVNQEAWKLFELGKEYYLDFTPA